MRLPFTQQQFLDVFVAYNGAVWPAQLVFYALGLAFVGFTLAGRAPGGRITALFLALSWAWMGAVYHLLFFRPINPVALVFGALFIVQAGLLAVHAFAAGGLPVRFSPGVRGLAGLLLVAYALVIYPAIGALTGHGYPASPLFGTAPCPSTIFTFGVLLWSGRRVPPYLLAIPLLWALIGSNASITLGIREDIGLLVAGLGGTALLLARGRRRAAAS